MTMYFEEGEFVQRKANTRTDAGRALSINTAYRVLHRQQNGLLTLEGYLMLVTEDDVRYATREQIASNSERYNR